MNHIARVALFILASCAAAAILEWIGLPAGLLLGPMIAAIAFAVRGGTLNVPSPVYDAGQALVGLMIASSLDLAILSEAAREPWLFIGATLATLGTAVLIGWLLAHWQILPGGTAIWGTMPGAATAMVLISRAEGANWQLVAVMTYLRITLVAGIASVLALVVSGHGGGAPTGGSWFPPLDALRLAETVVVCVVGVVLGKWLRIPAGSFVVPMILGAVLKNLGLVDPQLPGWWLAPAYLLVGWRIGLGFTPEIVKTAIRSAPRLVAAMGALIIICALCSVVLSWLSGKDLMTTYLAMSPGGADSVAIIAASTKVDLSFVMALQVARFLIVLIVGPPLARVMARRFQRRSSPPPP